MMGLFKRVQMMKAANDVKVAQRRADSLEKKAELSAALEKELARENAARMRVERVEELKAEVSRDRPLNKALGSVSAAFRERINDRLVAKPVDGPFRDNIASRDVFVPGAGRVNKRRDRVRGPFG